MVQSLVGEVHGTNQRTVVTNDTFRVKVPTLLECQLLTSLIEFYYLPKRVHDLHIVRFGASHNHHSSPAAEKFQ